MKKYVPVAKGTCHRCDCVVPGRRIYCDPCLEKVKYEQRRKYYLKNEAKTRQLYTGPCVSCKERPRRTDRSLYCEECRNKILTERRLKALKGVARGVCLKCGKPSRSKRAWYCEECTVKKRREIGRAANEKRRRARGQGVRVTYDTCQYPGCDSPPRTALAHYCEEHIPRIRHDYKRQSLRKKIIQNNDNARAVLTAVARELMKMAAGEQNMSHNTVKWCGRVLLNLEWGADRVSRKQREKSASRS